MHNRNHTREQSLRHETTPGSTASITHRTKPAIADDTHREASFRTQDVLSFNLSGRHEVDVAVTDGCCSHHGGWGRGGEGGGRLATVP